MTTTSTEATPKILLKEQKSRSTYKTTHKGSRASLYVPMNMRKRGKEDQLLRSKQVCMTMVAVCVDTHIDCKTYC
jgi:hypothetical protein